jgi:hypothetical protein
MATLEARFSELGLSPTHQVRDISKGKAGEPVCSPSTRPAGVVATKDRRADSILENDDRLHSDDQTIAVGRGQVSQAVLEFPKSAKDSIYSTIMTELRALCTQESVEEELLDFFENDIERIVRASSDNINNAASLWDETLQACLHEATHPAGDLNCKRLDTLDLLRTFTTESELDLTEFSEEQVERLRDSLHPDWIQLWIDLIQRHEEPTLWRLSAPQDSIRVESPLVPTYLFRVYDANSEGINRKDVIASGASINTSHDSRQDLLSIEGSDSARRLDRHLDWKSREASNLISWTSSLLSAIQCAKCRRDYHKWTANRVSICVVDTRKFSPDQFRAVDWLIARLEGKADDPQLLSKHTAWKGSGYDNGEYLSQGVMYLQGRSCTTSLQDLVDSGLYNIYPEFEGPSKRWATEVRELRSRLAYYQPITTADLETALEIAENCFGDVDNFDAMVILLTLRRRNRARRGPPLWTPCEVDRCYKTLRSGEERLDLDNGISLADVLAFFMSQRMME